jgi:hypothetical protein
MVIHSNNSKSWLIVNQTETGLPNLRAHLTTWVYISCVLGSHRINLNVKLAKEKCRDI